jgi:hypothetical protein
MIIVLKNLIILGEISMQKVKVHRYISGKKPQYAKNISSAESSEEEDFIDNKKSIVINKVKDLGSQQQENEKYVKIV